uniref:RAB36, member RAS onco family n=1 Tax=Catagonus wagneri TaxID=51154 RepID=A0A8C3WB74_9CETA
MDGGVGAGVRWEPLQAPQALPPCLCPLPLGVVSMPLACCSFLPEPGTGHTVRGPRAHLPALPAHRLSPTYPARGRRVSRCPAGGCRSLSPHIVLTGSSRLHPLSISGAIPAWSSPQRASVASRPSLSGVQSLHTASVNILGPHRFCKNVFNRDYKATIGVDFEIERFEVAGIPFSLQIWDTAGQEKFKCIASAYYRGAQVIIVAFDLTDVQTLAHTRQWLEDALRENEPGACFLFLVGTKKDLLVSRTDGTGPRAASGNASASLQLPAYATATAMPNPSHLCNLHHSSWQRCILSPLSEAGDHTCILMDTSRVRYL